MTMKTKNCIVVFLSLHVLLVNFVKAASFVGNHQRAHQKNSFVTCNQIRSSSNRSTKNNHIYNSRSRERNERLSHLRRKMGTSSSFPPISMNRNSSSIQPPSPPSDDFGSSVGAANDNHYTPSTAFTTKATTATTKGNRRVTLRRYLNSLVKKQPEVRWFSFPH